MKLFVVIVTATYGIVSANFSRTATEGIFFQTLNKIVGPQQEREQIIMKFGPKIKRDYANVLFLFFEVFQKITCLLTIN